MSNGNKTPTAEQQAIIELSPEPGLTLVVDSVAGSAKTTTLEMYARAHPESKILYLCFNNIAAAEARARFPKNVRCGTTHALAYSQTAWQFKGDKKVGTAPKSKAIMGPLGIRDARTAGAVLQVYIKFCQSADAVIGAGHLPHDCRNLDPKDQEAILDLARELWRRATDPKDIEIPVSHDTYAKLFQLSAYRAGQVPAVFRKYDVIAIDEAQDTNPTFESLFALIIAAGGHTTLLVGDERQAIYGWRGAVNMLARLTKAIREGKIPRGEILTLTQSFRYGPRAADLASRILALDSDHAPTIVGRGIDDPEHDGGRCYLSRTNAGLVEEALAAGAGGKPLHFAATVPPDYNPWTPYRFELIKSVYGHYAHQEHLITDPEIRRFEGWAEIIEHSTKAANGESLDQELAAAVRFVEKHGYNTTSVLDRIVESAGSPQEAALSFSTVHRAKGLEWDHVTMLEDFPLKKDEKGKIQIPSREEINLLYVGLTRGRYWMEINSTVESLLDLPYA
jgi:superfamily I DNA/RNA helicase